MPGYKQSEMFAPQPTEDKPDMKRRFVMPRFTMIQWTIVALVAYVAFSIQKAEQAGHDDHHVRDCAFAHVRPPLPREAW
jgi:hypothetical protein